MAKYRKSNSSTVVGIRIPNEDYSKIEQAAENNDMTAGQFIKDIVENYVKIVLK